MNSYLAENIMFKNIHYKTGKDVVLFYHHDLDGKGAAACAYNVLVGISNTIAMYEVDYSEDALQEGIKRIKLINEHGSSNGVIAIFVDYSFSESTIGVLKEICIDKHNEVIWLDHHHSSFDMFVENFEFLKSIEGVYDSTLHIPEKDEFGYYDYASFESIGGRINIILDQNRSGALISYLYFFQNVLIKTGDEYPMLASNPGSKINNHMPFLLISDYDLFTFDYSNTLAFYYGIMSKNISPDSVLWVDILNDTEGKIVSSIIADGKPISDYHDEMVARYKKFMYVTEIAGTECVVANIKDNSLIFGELYHKYPMCMIYVYDGEKYSYSIFTWDRSMDLEAIAKMYGGGGHRTAAGFSSKELLFKKVRDVE